MNVNITDIKRFAVHDGDGIRTTVFFKGCPLKCVWCHNPETIQSKPTLAFYAHKCTLCGSCAAACQCHKIENGIHTINRERCTLCGICAEKCQQEALVLYGREISCEEVCRILLEDKEFYAVSEKLYQQANPQGAAGGPDMGGAAPGGEQYYDADYTVVDEDENK